VKRAGALAGLVIAVLAFGPSLAVSPARVAIDGEVIYIPDGVTVTIVGGNASEVSPSTSPTATTTPSIGTAAPTAQPTAQPTPTFTASTLSPSPSPSTSVAPTPTASPTTTPSPTPGTDFIGPDPTGPTSGSAWTALKAAADANPGTPDITCNQDNRQHPGTTLAAALVYARTGIESYRTKAIALIEAAYPTARSCGNAVLSLGRQLSAYVLAADYVGYRSPAFVSWLSDIRTRNLGGHGRWFILRGTADDSPNNWGTFAQASLVAADAYLGDEAALEKDWLRFRGFTGDRSAFTFPYPSDGDASWECVAQSQWTPVAICPGNPRDGAISEDAERSGAYPKISLTYVQEGMQGLGLVAEILTGEGYDAWPRLERVSDFATRQGVWNASAVGRHVPWLWNARLDAGAPTQPAGFGRGFGHTDWLYGP
jgi:hypothetical protein